jgi:hypothetical protein
VKEVIMHIRLEKVDEYEEDGELVVHYTVLDNEGCQIATATTAQRNGTRFLVSVEDEMVFHNGVGGESFKEALDDAENLVDILRHYTALESEGTIVCTSSESSPSILFFELAPAKGCEPFTTDEELRQLVAERCSVIE